MLRVDRSAGSELRLSCFPPEVSKVLGDRSGALLHDASMAGGRIDCDDVKAVLVVEHVGQVALQGLIEYVTGKSKGIKALNKALLERNMMGLVDVSISTCHCWRQLSPSDNSVFQSPAAHHISPKFVDKCR